MRKITELTEVEARIFLLEESSYANFVLPHYFSFQNMLSRFDLELSGRNLKGFREADPRDFENINYKLLTNKDGKYAWRPFQLIHPAIYVSLVHKITDRNKWKQIQKRFGEFSSNEKIECHSLPVKSDSQDQSDKDAQIYSWWRTIEQRSIALALEYRYLLQTDITDCYGSLYTHSITWAMHGKGDAKKKENRKRKDWIGVEIDQHLQDMSFGQTNGIPQGSIVMDFISEIVLGYVDLLLSSKIEELGISIYKILRYRDDYCIFTNNPFEADQITKALSEILSEMGLKLNPDKTVASDDVIKNSIKADKRYWISNRRITENKQKWLIQLYTLSEQFPNSGTLETQMRGFLKVVEKSQRKDPNIHSLISLVVEISFRNPRVSPTAILILTYLINQIEDKTEKQDSIKKIRSKFMQVPNSSLLKVWLQRLFLKLDHSLEYEEPLCQKVLCSEVNIWNSKWLSSKFERIIEEIPVVNYESVAELQEIASEDEIKALARMTAYNFQAEEFADLFE